MESQSTDASYVFIKTGVDIPSEQSQNEAGNLRNISAVSSPGPRGSMMIDQARKAVNAARMCGVKQLVIAKNYTLLNTLVTYQPTVLQQDNTDLILMAAGKGFGCGSFLTTNQAARFSTGRAYFSK